MSHQPLGCPFENTMCDPGRHQRAERHSHQDGHQHRSASNPASSSHHHSSHHGSSRTGHGCAKRGGRPVTWIGGGGMDPKRLASLGVPTLRALFSQVFGEQTASNNACWLRRKLAESPDNVHGQRRSPVVRARDLGAAIWNPCCSPLVVEGGAGSEGGYEEEEDEDMAEQGLLSSLEGTATTTGGPLDQGETELRSCSSLFSRRSLKRSAASAESADTLGYHGSLMSPAPSGSGSASPTARGGSHSPRCRPSSQRHRSHNTVQHEAAQGSVILLDSFNDDYLGLKVLVFWPADNKWWAATICKLNTTAQQMQLLYTDMTEESVTGADFEDLLRNGHLLLAAGQRPPSSTGMLHTEDAAQECTQAPDFAPAAQQPLAWPAEAAGGSLCPSRSQSCLLPQAVCCHLEASKDLSRSASMGAGSAGDSRRSASGSGAEYEEMAAKRPCYELSATTCASGIASSDRFACGSMPQPLAAEQAPGDAAKLCAWFASQQRQQLELQQQVPNNMQCQQQAQMQMHQQMTVHMQMQQAAGQYMHIGVPALAAPGARSGCGDDPASMFAASAAAADTATVAGDVPHAPLLTEGSGGLAEEIRQLRQLHLLLQRAVTQPDVAASCWASLQLGPVGASSNPVAAPAAAISPRGHDQLQQQTGEECFAGRTGLSVMVPAAGGSSLAGSAAGSPVPLQQPATLDDAVVPAATSSPVAAGDVYVMCSNSPAAPTAAAAAPAAAIKQEPAGQVLLAGASTAAGSSALEGDSPDDIDTLLSKDEGMFCLSDLACDMQAEDGMQDAYGGPSSSCGGGSLCESVADELAVAGLGADDAPCYFSLFGSGGDCEVVGDDAGAGLGEPEPPAVVPSAPAGTNASDAEQAEHEAFAHMFDDFC